MMARDEGRGANHKQQQPNHSEWLVMIYLAGDNNLSVNSLAILQELEEATYSRDVRVLACFDSNTPRPRGARYFEINRRRQHPDPDMDWALHDDLVPFDKLPDHPVKAPDFCKTFLPHEPAPKPPTGPVAKEGLSRFIEFALSGYQAQRHMLILYGHGSAVAGNTFLVDDNPPSFLRLKDFKEVLSRHFDNGHRAEQQTGGDPKKPPLDILACDNCIMNGVESAFEIRKQVKYVIGSQGLALALGWPFRNLLNEVVRHRNARTEELAGRILRVCARSLVDFALMDRSSEQSLCDLTTFGRRENLVAAVRELSGVLQEYLATDDCGDVIYPAVRDAVRLARLEAQSYWAETFVDLYDFCALLLERCNDILCQTKIISDQLLREDLARSAGDTGAAELSFPELPFIQPFDAIAGACWKVLNEIRVDKNVRKRAKSEEAKFVLSSYYVGPELQYSNGVSIYFPWTLPEDPIIFDPVPGSGGGGSYYLSWSRFERVQRLLKEKRLAVANESSYEDEPPEDFELRTAFDEYLDYDFAQPDGADWAAFLEVFFRATLRNVRRFDVHYQGVHAKDRDKVAAFFRAESIPEEPFVNPTPVNLQKSSSDVDSETDCSCPTIKNYPRRFYVSPRDCLRRCDLPRRDSDCYDKKVRDCYHKDDPKDRQDQQLCVSYLGWNVRGIVADVIKLKKQPKPKPSDAADDGSKAGPRRKPKP